MRADGVRAAQFKWFRASIGDMHPAHAVTPLTDADAR